MGNSCGRPIERSSYSQEKRDTGAFLASSQFDGNPLHTGSILGLGSTFDKTISCSDDKRICLMDWVGSQPLYCIGHEKAVNRVISLNGFVWSVSRDLSLRQWNAASASPVQVIANTHELNVSAVAAHSRGHSVFTGSRDYHVKGWDIETGKCTSTFSNPRNIVTALEFDQSASSANLLYQSSEDLCVRVWDVRSSSGSGIINHISGFVYFPLCISMDCDGNMMATGCKGFNSVGCEVKLWDLRKTSKPLAEYLGHSQDVTAVKFSRDGYLLSVSKDGTIMTWNPKLAAQRSTTDPTLRNQCVSMLSTDKNYTSLCVVNEGTDNQSSFALGAFDGSISLATMKKDETITIERMTDSSC